MPAASAAARIAAESEVTPVSPLDPAWTGSSAGDSSRADSLAGTSSSTTIESSRAFEKIGRTSSAAWGTIRSGGHASYFFALKGWISNADAFASSRLNGSIFEDPTVDQCPSITATLACRKLLRYS